PLWVRSRRRPQSLSPGSAVVARHRKAGGRRAGRGIPGVAVGEVHHRRKPGYRGHNTRPHLGLILAALVVASAARFMSLGARPMHADEGVLADKFGSFLETGNYAYDPGEHHGPALAYITWLPAWLTGHRTYQALTEKTLRAAPAAAGLLVALLPLLLARVLGR